jgi:hypothetical protein
MLMTHGTHASSFCNCEVRLLQSFKAAPALAVDTWQQVSVSFSGGRRMSVVRERWLQLRVLSGSSA